jgi:hypothetical protein
MDEINLGELSRPEAVMVMNRFPEIAREDFPLKREMYGKIGGHPYTINIFGRHARIKSVREVLMDIADVNKEMIDFTLINITYEKYLTKRARELIHRISVFRKSIPLEALEWMMRDNGEFSILTKEIEDLFHWGLLVRIDEDESALYQIHTLVKDFIKTNVEEDEWKRWLIKGAEFYEDLVKSTHNIWDYLDARELYFEAEEYNRSGEIVSNVMEPLHRWGFIELVRR